MAGEKVDNSATVLYPAELHGTAPVAGLEPAPTGLLGEVSVVCATGRTVDARKAAAPGNLRQEFRAILVPEPCSAGLRPRPATFLLWQGFRPAGSFEEVTFVCRHRRRKSAEGINEDSSLSSVESK